MVSKSQIAERAPELTFERDRDEATGRALPTASGAAVNDGPGVGFVFLDMRGAMNSE